MASERSKAPETTQRDLFVEKARELGCDEDEDRFNKTLKQIVLAKTEKDKKPTKE